MKKTIIKDIRLYKGGIQTEAGDLVTVSFADKKLNAMVQRIVMKLRENRVSLGEFDHLYITFIPCDQAETMTLSREADRHLTFRDFLRNNPEAAAKYGRVKEEAARRYPEDIDGYIAYKSACIAELYRQCGLA